MRAHTLTVANGRTPEHQQVIKAWGSTVGGATPTLTSPSWGTASITDIAVGTLDVTFEAAVGSATYCVVGAGQGTATFGAVTVSNNTIPTSTVVRLIMGDQVGATSDLGTGFHWILYAV